MSPTTSISISTLVLLSSTSLLECHHPSAASNEPPVLPPHSPQNEVSSNSSNVDGNGCVNNIAVNELVSSSPPTPDGCVNYGLSQALMSFVPLSTTLLPLSPQLTMPPIHQGRKTTPSVKQPSMQPANLLRTLGNDGNNKDNHITSRRKDAHGVVTDNKMQSTPHKKSAPLIVSSVLLNAPKKDMVNLQQQSRALLQSKGHVQHAHKLNSEQNINHPQMMLPSNNVRDSIYEKSRAVDNKKLNQPFSTISTTNTVYRNPPSPTPSSGERGSSGSSDQGDYDDKECIDSDNDVSQDNSRSAADPPSPTPSSGECGSSDSSEQEEYDDKECIESDNDVSPDNSRSAADPPSPTPSSGEGGSSDSSDQEEYDDKECIESDNDVSPDNSRSAADPPSPTPSSGEGGSSDSSEQEDYDDKECIDSDNDVSQENSRSAADPPSPTPSSGECGSSDSSEQEEYDDKECIDSDNDVSSDNSRSAADPPSPTPSSGEGGSSDSSEQEDYDDKECIDSDNDVSPDNSRSAADPPSPTPSSGERGFSDSSEQEDYDDKECIDSDNVSPDNSRSAADPSSPTPLLTPCLGEKKPEKVFQSLNTIPSTIKKQVDAVNRGRMRLLRYFSFSSFRVSK